MLYVTVGDGQDPANSQGMDSVNGKILRYVPNGSIPASNPYGSFRAAYNLGLRNSFDFDFHPLTGTIYASENGPDCDDEINRIVPGANYGWWPNYPCGGHGHSVRHADHPLHTLHRAHRHHLLYRLPLSSVSG